VPTVPTVPLLHVEVAKQYTTAFVSVRGSTAFVSVRGSTWQAAAMLMAVSSLSPVHTQIFMPAIASWWIVSGTPSWSLSSIAVAPSSSRSCSICSAISSILFGLPSRCSRDMKYIG
jgi:hypothetical protein